MSNQSKRAAERNRDHCDGDCEKCGLRSYEFCSDCSKCRECDCKCNIIDVQPIYKFCLRDDIKDDKRFLPTRATSRSSGWDVSAAFEDHKALIVQPGEYIKIPLGFRTIMPEGWWLECRPRSSTFTKKNIQALYGVIDNDFNLQCWFCGYYSGKEELKIEFGERIGQLIPVKLQTMEVNEISSEEFDYICSNQKNDRIGGFGSSG